MKKLVQTGEDNNGVFNVMDGLSFVQAFNENANELGTSTKLDLEVHNTPEAVVKAVANNKAPFVGLSALMTTTVVNMEATIKELREKAPWCKIMVGGAVLTQEYADMIGADFYGKDAMQTVYYVEGNL